MTLCNAKAPIEKSVQLTKNNLIATRAIGGAELVKGVAIAFSRL